MLAGRFTRVGALLVALLAVCGITTATRASATPTTTAKHVVTISSASLRSGHHSTWWKTHCTPQRARNNAVQSRQVKPRSRVSSKMWSQRRHEEELFLRCDLNISAHLASAAIQQNKKLTIPTISDYIKRGVSIVGEELPKAPGKPGKPSMPCTKCLIVQKAPSGVYAPMDTTHKGDNCYRSYDHNDSAWWDEELYSCLHYTGVAVTGGNSYFTRASISETVQFSFWGFGDVDDGDLNNDDPNKHDAKYPWMSHGQTYGQYPWVEAHTNRVFSASFHVSTHGAGFKLVPTWYVCGNPIAYANGYETNAGTTCYYH